MALSRSTASPLTPSRWPPGDELGSSRTGDGQHPNASNPSRRIQLSFWLARRDSLLCGVLLHGGQTQSDRQTGGRQDAP